MQLAVAITAATRPRPTLATSVESLRTWGGFRDSVHVFADGQVEDVDGVRMWHNEPPLGCFQNWAHAVETLLRVERRADWLLILEDDVWWCDGAREAIERDVVSLDPSVVGYLSLYLSRRVSRSLELHAGGGRLRDGIYGTRIGGQCWGSQAYLMPRLSAQALLAWPAFKKRRADLTRSRERDTFVSDCLDRMGRTLLYRVPCLVNHELGANDNSTLWTADGRTRLGTDYFRGHA